MCGGGECDPRKVPPPPKGYVEPQPDAYARLSYLATNMKSEYESRGFELQNLRDLQRYINILAVIREYTKLELANTKFDDEKIIATPYDSTCTEYSISPESAVERYTGTDVFFNPKSRWEELRVGIVGGLVASLPTPTEGPILPLSQRRAALVADVHTAGDEGILEEAIGVPRVIFVAVKDVNGARLTVGFTYSHYEFVSPPGVRLNDDEWQRKLYKEGEPYDQVTEYKPKASWPDVTQWYQILLGTK